MTHVATLKFQGRERKSRLKFCIMLQHAHLLEIQKLQLSQKKPGSLDRKGVDFYVQNALKLAYALIPNIFPGNPVRRGGGRVAYEYL